MMEFIEFIISRSGFVGIYRIDLNNEAKGLRVLDK